MGHVMANARGAPAQPQERLWQDRPAEEQRVLKLLSLVSFKISERFRNLREAFRHIDTDHSQSISLNEWA